LRRSVSAFVGDPLQLVEHDAGDHERPLEESRLDDVGDPAVDDGARVDHHVRLARVRRALGRRAPEDADRLGRQNEIVALGNRQAGHPEAQEDRHPERQPRPERRGHRASGSPSRSPSRDRAVGRPPL